MDRLVSDDERRLLILLAEGMLNKARGELATYRLIATAGNRWFVGYSKATTDTYAHLVEIGEIWIARLEGLLAEVTAMQEIMDGSL